MPFNNFTNEFTNSPIQTSYPSYLLLDYTEINEYTLEWSFQNQNTLYPFSNVIQVIDTSVGASLILPNASVTSAGTTTAIINSGLNPIEVYKNDGTTLVVTIETTQQWQLVLTDNSTSNGSWLPIQLGATTSAAVATSLIDNTDDTNTHSNAGGLAAFPPNWLKQNILVNKVLSPETTYTQASGDRGALLVWESGTGTYQCLSANTLTAGFCFAVQNGGTGVLTIQPSATIGQSINSSPAVFQLFPGESSLFTSDGNQTIYSYGSTQTSTIQTTLVDVNLITAVSNIITLSDVQAAASIQTYVNNNGVNPITINYPIPVGQAAEYIAFNASTTTPIIIQINGETDPTYQFLIAPLNRLNVFNNGQHLYNVPNFISEQMVGLLDGTVSNPSLYFNNSINTGIFRPTSGSYVNNLAITQDGVASMYFAELATGPNTSMNTINTVGGSYSEEGISIFSLMRAYG